MRFFTKILLIFLALTAGNSVTAQETRDDNVTESDRLKITAIEMLISAPAERALPLVARVLSANHSDAVKSRALIILSQIELPEAQTLLLETATNGSPELKLHAIRMIGVGGDTNTLAGLTEIYKNGDRDVRDSVLRAYLIADDPGAVYAVAVNATSEEEFEAAVRVLGAMGATNELRQLGDRGMTSESLIHAYAIAEDLEALNKLALDASNPATQIQAIQGLGIIGGDEANASLMEIYRSAGRDEISRAALHGMLVAGHEEGVLELFRASQDATEKRELLQLLVIMDSDAALDIISATLESDP
ncbi:MAG: HEAT repeat domain-containing protein [Pseudomonadales bacterium]